MIRWLQRLSNTNKLSDLEVDWSNHKCQSIMLQLQIMAAPYAQAEQMTSKKFQTCVFHLDNLKNRDLETERKLYKMLKDKERF